MSFTCDHDASKSSLRVFLASTERHTFQDFGDEAPPLLLGNCRQCTSTIAIEVDLARGSAVKGTIEASDEPPPVREPGFFDDETARLIR